MLFKYSRSNRKKRNLDNDNGSPIAIVGITASVVRQKRLIRYIGKFLIKRIFSNIFLRVVGEAYCRTWHAFQDTNKIAMLQST